ARGNHHRGVPRARALERVPHVRKPVLEHPGEVRVAGPRQRHRLLALALGLALRRPRVHPPGPALVVAVAHEKGKRRSERPPVAEPGEHLDLVGLDLLARAAPVALLAAAKILVDRGPVEHQPGRKAADDRDQRGPVRLPGGDERKGHGAKPTAARITSTGAGIPVHSSNDAAPCATSTSRPSTTVAPAARAARAVAVSGYGRSTSVWPGPRSTSTSSRAAVALTTRSAPAASGGHSPLRANCRAPGSASRNATAEPPSPRITGRSEARPSRMAASVER